MSEWPDWFRFAVAVLATWRVAHLVAREDGPFDVIVRVRARVGTGPVGQLMDCPYCLSLWIAAPFTFAIGRGAAAWIAGWLSISGGACLIERLTRPRLDSSSMNGG